MILLSTIPFRKFNLNPMDSNFKLFSEYFVNVPIHETDERVH